MVCIAPAQAQHSWVVERLRIYAAGSLRSAFDELLVAFGASSGVRSLAIYGPSGLLRERLEKGETGDVFASADLSQPEQLAMNASYLPVVLFARSAMCALGRERLGLTETNLLDQMINPNVKLLTGKPKADPSGDYAMAVFDRAEELRPGAGSTLRAKQGLLAGVGPNAPGHDAIGSAFLSGRADIVLGYCSSADAEQRATPGLVVVHLPAALAVTPELAMTVRSGDPDAMRFALFVMSLQGQAILERHHLSPVAAPESR